MNRNVLAYCGAIVLLIVAILAYTLSLMRQPSPASSSLPISNSLREKGVDLPLSAPSYPALRQEAVAEIKRERVGWRTVRVVDENGLGLHDASGWFEVGMPRCLVAGCAVATSDESGRMDLPEFNSHGDEEAKQSVLVGKEGYQTRRVGHMDEIDDGMVVTLEALQRVVFECRGANGAVQGVRISASERQIPRASEIREQQRAEWVDADSLLPGPNDATSIVRATTDQDGLAQMWLRRGRKYWIEPKSETHVAKDGHPLVRQVEAEHVSVEMLELAVLYAVAQHEDILGAMPVMSDAIPVRIQDVVRFAEVMNELKAPYRQNGVFAIWGVILSRDQPPLGSPVSVELLLSNQGWTKCELHTQSPRNAKPEVIPYDESRARVAPLVMMEVASAVGGAAAGRALKLRLETDRKFLRFPMSIRVQPNTEVRLPLGAYRLSSENPEVNEALDPDCLTVVVTATTERHSIRFKEPLYPVRFVVADNDGVPEMRGLVNLERIGADGKQRRVSVGVTRFTTIFWLGSGPWMCRISDLSDGRLLEFRADVPGQWARDEVEGVILVAPEK